MEIKAKVFKRDSNIAPTIKAMASITIDDMIVIRDIKVIEGKNGLFFAMPSKKMSDGTYKDIAFPITKETRQQISEAILNAYNTTDEQIIDDLPF